VKNRKLLRPSALALYIAASAFLISVSQSVPCSGKMLMPMLQLIFRDMPLNDEFSGHCVHEPLSGNRYVGHVLDVSQ
jgi:hypothetical protein